MEMSMLGEVTTYSDLHVLLRARAVELGLSRESIDAISGLQPGYAAKLLSPRPMKRLGATSMPLILPALGVKLVLMVDDEKTLALQQRSTVGTRNESAVRGAVTHFSLSRRFFQKIGRKGGANRRANMTKRRASELGRRAANARWKAAAR
jgi:hypothetical protein